MNLPLHILVFRFSALGDVVMTIPVLKNLLNQHPALRITVASQPFFQPLFEGIDRLNFYPVDIKTEYSGLRGLYKLSRRIKKEIQYDTIADLHDSLRTKVLRFFLQGKTAVIDKGRKEKKGLTRPKNKMLRPLKTTFQRYADVFEELGLPVTLNIPTGILPPKSTVSLLPREKKVLIGVAPFAKHAPKMYPMEKMKEVVCKLAQRTETAVLLFGNRDEAAILRQWEKEIKNVYSMAGKFSFADELAIISNLDLVISMDSANMHLASLFGIPVVSIWGGTHPFAGFYGWGQSMDQAIQIDYPCRPSSVFGEKVCPVHGDRGCMEGITDKMIVHRAEEVLRLNTRNHPSASSG